MAVAAEQAAYECWSTTGGRMQEHHDVRIVVDQGRVRATVADEMTIEGQVVRAGGRVVALAFIPAS